MCKKYVLTLIGLWGKRYQHTWRVTTSRSEDDRLGALFKSVELPDGCLELYTRSETITNVSMLPIHLIALNMEHVYVRLAIDAARLRGYGIKGIRVDCVYWDKSKRCVEDVTGYPDWMRHEPTDEDDMKDDMRVMREVLSGEGHWWNQCGFKLEKAKAPFAVKWEPPEIIPEESHWRHESCGAEAGTKTGRYCSWVKAPILDREWTRAREDQALELIFRDAPPLCRAAITTVIRNDRPDVTR